MPRLILFFLLSAPMYAQCSGFAYSRTIDIDRTKVPSTQSNFTVLIVKTDPGLADVAHGGNVRNVAGGKPMDLVFCDIGNSALKFWEIDSYDNTTGAIVAYVLEPSLNGAGASADTQYHVLAGNSAVNTFQGGPPGSAWDSYTKAMYHFGNGSTLSLADSSASLNNATNHGTAAAAGGKVSGGLSLNLGYAQAADAGLPAGASPKTFSAWIIAGSQQGLTGLYGTNSPGNCVYTFAGQEGRFWVGTCGATNLDSGITVNDGAWHHTAAVYDGSIWRTYVDGVAGATAALGTNNTILSSLIIGWITSAGDDLTAEDELRIDAAARSADWITTLYNNQSNPGAFVSIIADAAAGPAISNATCAGNSPSSILCSWTTDTPSSSQVQCTGNSITYSTPVVNPVRAGISPFWGVTSHSMVITGLPNNTASNAYSCIVLSQNQAGSTSSVAAGNSGTTSPVASTAVALSWISPPTRLNDQYNGSNGMPNNGRWFDGDTQFHTWADDGNDYGICEDCRGVNGQFGATDYNLLGWIQWDPTYLNPTQINGVLNWRYVPYNPTSLWGSDGLISVRGVIYQGVAAFNSDNGTSVIKSPDHLQTSLSPQHNAGPDTNVVSGMTCAGGTVTVTSKLNLTDVTINSPGVLRVTVAGANPPAWNGTFAVTATTPATIQYAQACPGSAWTGGGTIGVTGADVPSQGHHMWNSVAQLINWVQCDGKDYTCTPVAGMDAWVYSLVLGGPLNGVVLSRIRIEDLPLQDATKFQYYKGTQTGDDGLYDSAWDSDITKASYISASMFSRTLINSWGAKPQMVFVPDFNRFLVTSGAVNRNACTSGGAALYDAGLYPWGKWTAVGSIQRDLRFTGYMPAFPQLLSATYSKVSSNPLVANMLLTTSGVCAFLDINGAGATDNYTTWLRRARLVAGVSPTGAPQSSAAKTMAAAARVSSAGRRAHIASGLDLYYDFQGIPGSTFITNRSPNDPDGKWTWTGTVQDLIYYDQYGMYNFGIPGDAVLGFSSVWRSPQSYALTTPYAETLTASTTIICFGHYPGTTIQPVVSGEVVLNKSGDLKIARHGTTATWDVIFGNTVTGAVSIADGAFGCIAVRRDAGNNVTVYNSSGIGESFPLAPGFGPVTVSGPWSANPLIVGDAANSLRGIVSELLVWSRALADAELIHEMSVIRAEMKARGVTLP